MTGRVVDQLVTSTAFSAMLVLLTMLIALPDPLVVRAEEPATSSAIAEPTVVEATATPSADIAPSADIRGDSRDGFVDLLSADAVKRWVPDGRTENARKSQWSRWTFQDNLLHCAGKQYGFIRFDQKVCDFSLQLEFRFATTGGNSGIGIRGLPYREHSTRPSVVAYELQILDDAGKKPSRSGNMSLYHQLAPTDNAMRPAGEWNRLEVICRGPQLTVGLNGKTVQDVDQTQHERLKEKPLCGYILLQNHSHPIDFRNLHLKVLKAPSSDPTNRTTRSHP